jgi:hypothetical protein
MEVVERHEIASPCLGKYKENVEQGICNDEITTGRRNRDLNRNCIILRNFQNI